MLEGEYLELVNDLKKRFDVKEKEMEDVKNKYVNLLKVFISAYGFIRVIDSCEDLNEKEGLLEILRSYLSERFDEFLSGNNIIDE